MANQCKKYDPNIGDTMFAMAEKLYPICRSITGSGVRESLDILADYIDIDIFEVESGEKVFDWTVPDEWNLAEAYIEDENGNRVVDTANHNLHVMSYSTPVDATFSLDELQPHLHSLPEQPELIPYRTSYYNAEWGFCLSHNQRTALKKGNYRVKVDSRLTKGSLTYGEAYIPGRSDHEILISTHICHPSLANDNLSGITVATQLASAAMRQESKNEYGLRFIFIPSTIGAITWLAKNQEKFKNIVSGLVISGVGDHGQFTYKTSRNNTGLFDKVLPDILIATSRSHEIRNFSPYGYDERQFCSLGVDLPVGCLMRTPFGEYPEYHTSADNLDFISKESLKDTYDLLSEVIANIQHVKKFENMQPNCEPQLGKRGLYDTIGGDNDAKESQMAILWMLAYSDGVHNTYDISKKSGIALSKLSLAAQRLVDANLLSELPLTTN